MKRLHDRMSAASELLLCLGGPLIWAGHFFAMYGAQTLFCFNTPPRTGVPFVTFAIAFTAIAIAGMLGLMTWQLVREGRQGNTGNALDDGSRFLRAISIMLGTAALLAVMWSAIPTIMLPACSGATP